MTTELKCGLWEAARKMLHQRFGDEVFERWFRRLSLIGVEGDEVRLGVANSFVLDWIQARYLAPITEACRNAAGREILVRLRVDPELFREHRRDEEEEFRSAAIPDLDPAHRLAAAIPALDAQPPPKRSRDPVPPEPTLETFIAGASSRLVCRAVLEVLERPGEAYNPLFVYGAPGVGKTHLAKGMHRALRSGGFLRLGGRWSAGAHEGGDAAAPRSVEVPRCLKVRYVTAERFFNHYVASVQDRTLEKFRECYRSLDVLIIEDIRVLETKKKTQIEFLNTFAALVDAGKQVIITSDVSPRELTGMDPSLVGRLMSGLLAHLAKPDYATRRAILRFQAGRRRRRFDPAVFDCIAENVRGTPRELIGALTQIDAETEAHGGIVDAAAARRVLDDRIRRQQARMGLERIHQVVCEHYAISEAVLISPDRRRHVSHARQVAMYLARISTRKPFAEIGKYFGNRKHATVKLAVSKITQLLEPPDSPVARDVRTITEVLEAS